MAVQHGLCQTCSEIKDRISCLMAYLCFYLQVGKDTFKIAALYLHILVVLGLAVAVCVLMGLKSGGGEDGDDSHEHD